MSAVTPRSCMVSSSENASCHLELAVGGGVILLLLLPRLWFVVVVLVAPSLCLLCTKYYIGARPNTRSRSKQQRDATKTDENPRATPLRAVRASRTTVHTVVPYLSLGLAPTSARTNNNR